MSIHKRFVADIDLSFIQTIPQRDTNRCWLICAISEQLSRFCSKTGWKHFSISLNYLAFWDCIEKCKRFFDNIIATKEYAITSEQVQSILKFGIDDGGDWINAAEIITKYGIVHEFAMPETIESASPEQLFTHINVYAKHTAYLLRKAPEAEQQQIKEMAMSKIYTYLVRNCGSPPATFPLNVKMGANTTTIAAEITPRQLADLIMGDALLNRLNLISIESVALPYKTKYHFPYNGYHVLFPHIQYINIPFPELKDKVIQQIQDGKAVPIACDARYFQQPPNHLFDVPKAPRELDFEVDRNIVFDYTLLRINHCMLITGLSRQLDGTLLWKLANSWASNADEYYYATDAWFDRFVFEAIIHKKYCAEHQWDEKYMLPTSIII